MESELATQSETIYEEGKEGIAGMEQWNKGLYDLLSLLANRMARVCGSGSPSLTSAAAFHTQLRSLPTLGESFISGTT